jgi:hypothetical protein
MTDELERVLREIPLREPSSSLDQRIAQTLAAAGDEPPAPLPFRRRGRNPKPWIFIAAPIAALLALALFVTPMLSPSAPDPTHVIVDTTPPNGLAVTHTNIVPRNALTLFLMPMVSRPQLMHLGTIAAVAPTRSHPGELDIPTLNHALAVGEAAAPIRIARTYTDVVPGDALVLAENNPYQPMHEMTMVKTTWVDQANDVRIEITVPRERILLVRARVD